MKNPSFPGILIPFIIAIMAVAFSEKPANALESFDFEARYLVHPGNQIWDFCLIPNDDQYHVFYHTISPDLQHPANADTIWHAVSTDLRRWEILGPALTSGPHWWDAEALWAPDVVFDELNKRWAMLYTGVGQGMVQRACLAWSDDLVNWTKAAENPVFEPDSQIYFWAPDQEWSSFRDPEVYYENDQWNMLSTAGIRVGGFPGHKRAIVHRAVSNDLIHWTDAGPFFQHDGADGQGYDFESVQYIKRNGNHHLFFVEQDPNLDTHSTSLISARSTENWTMADRIYFDEGWAPEIQSINGNVFDTMFGRLYQYDNPHTNLTQVIIRFDALRFQQGGSTPWMYHWDPLEKNWPIRIGTVGAAAPTFGDNPILRGEHSSGFQGNGWFSSYENFGGPLSGIGEPGLTLGDSATGGLMGKDFIVSGDYLHFLLAGGYYPETCFISLVDAHTDEMLFRTTGTGSPLMNTQFWDLRGHFGRVVKLLIVDNETGPNGWIAVDSITEAMSAPTPAEDTMPPTYRLDGCYPNPFNPQTTVSFRLAKAEMIEVDVYDVKGLHVTQLASQIFSSGSHALTWNGRDSQDRVMPSGPYFVRLSTGTVVESRKVLLLK